MVNDNRPEKFLNRAEKQRRRKMDQDFEIRKMAISIVVQHLGGQELSADTLVAEAKKVESFLRGQ